MTVSPEGTFVSVAANEEDPHMPSAALIEWQTTRSTMLDELHAIHSTVGGTAPGRRWRTQQINWAIILRLAGEFQGFARDLHTLSTDCLADWSCGGNQAARRIVAATLTLNRQLDRGNAQPASLGSDFGRLGLDFWTSLTARDSRTPSRQTHLERLNAMRLLIANRRSYKRLLRPGIRPPCRLSGSGVVP